MSGWRIFWRSSKWDLLGFFACLWAANASRGFFAGLAGGGIFFLGILLAFAWKRAWIQADQETKES